MGREKGVGFGDGEMGEKAAEVEVGRGQEVGDGDGVVVIESPSCQVMVLPAPPRSGSEVDEVEMVTWPSN